VIASRLTVPSPAWQIISVDFIAGLSLSVSANSILVVVDKYTKFAHFVPPCHPLARLFMDHIYRLHGLPKSIIPDRDRIFTSRFVATLIQDGWHSIADEFGISPTDGWPNGTGHPMP